MYMHVHIYMYRERGHLGVFDAKGARAPKRHDPSALRAGRPLARARATVRIPSILVGLIVAGLNPNQKNKKKINKHQ